MNWFDLHQARLNMRSIGEGEALTWVIDPSLDDVVQCEASGGFLVAQACVHLRGKHLGHVVVVLAEVRVLLLGRVCHLHLIVGIAERHGCSELMGGKR